MAAKRELTEAQMEELLDSIAGADPNISGSYLQPGTTMLALVGAQIKPSASKKSVVNLVVEFEAMEIIEEHPTPSSDSPQMKVNGTYAFIEDVADEKGESNAMALVLALGGFSSTQAAEFTKEDRKKCLRALVSGELNGMLVCLKAWHKKTGTGGTYTSKRWFPVNQESGELVSAVEGVAAKGDGYDTDEDIPA
jgi:hypothetical protein